MPSGMSMYSASVPQLTKMLRNLERWLDKAETHATAKSFDPNTLLGARLAPDMYPLVRQIQSACDTAKFVAARLSGKDAPKNPDTETTVAELRERIHATVAFLETVTEADFEGAAERLVAVSYLPPNKRFKGSVYLNEVALPNFYFHATMAYAIVRHNGVDVGKMDYIGDIALVDV